MPLGPSFMPDVQKAFEDCWTDITTPIKKPRAIKLAQALSKAFLDSTTAITAPLVITGMTPPPPPPTPLPYFGAEVAKLKFPMDTFPLMNNFDTGWGNTMMAPQTAKSDSDFFAKGFIGLLQSGTATISLHTGVLALTVPPASVLAATLMPMFLSVYSTPGFVGAQKAKSIQLASSITPLCAAVIPTITVTGPVTMNPIKQPLIGGIAIGNCI